MLLRQDRFDSDVAGFRHDKLSEASFDDELNEEVLEVWEWVLCDLVANEEFVGAKAEVSCVLNLF